MNPYDPDALYVAEDEPAYDTRAPMAVLYALAALAIVLLGIGYVVLRGKV